jgi:hypothetical protein
VAKSAMHIQLHIMSLKLVFLCLILKLKKNILCPDKIYFKDGYIATFFADPSIIARMRKLRQVILNQYNNNNVTEYEKLTAKIS